MASGTSAAAAAVLAATEPWADGAAPARFALEVRAGQDPAAVAAAVGQRLGELATRVSPLSDLDHDVLVLELPERTLRGEPASAFAAGYALAQDFDLRGAEPDLPTAFFPEQDPPAHSGPFVDEGPGGFPPWCWAPEEPGLDATWALDTVRAPQAWSFSEERGRPARGAGVVIAQPDTGVTAHAELAGVRRVGGFDVLDGDPDPTDPLEPEGNPGHGTGTASVVVSPATLQVVGSAPQASHMPIRAVHSVVRLTQVTVARGIDRAVADGAQVITMSLGGIPALALHRALRRAVDADVIVLAAAGNCVRTVVWPARYDECIAVAGTTAADQPWQGSCRGAAVDISAPGQNVLRASVPRGGPPGDAVGQGQGTSFAVAITAGVAALWLAHHGRANLVAAARAREETLQAMFRRLVRATARRPSPWDPFTLGTGIVDARALLEADLDLGRDRESAEPPADPAERAAVSVASLVAETVGVQAAAEGALDWRRFGPELAAVLLAQQLTRPIAPGVRPETPPPPVTGLLAGSVGNPALRDWLGLDDRLPPEVGRQGAPE